MNTRKFLATWFITGIALIIAANFIPGFTVTNTNSAIAACLTLGLVTACLRPMLLVFDSFPLNIVTFSMFLFLINSTTTWITTVFTPTFQVAGFVPNLAIALLLATISSLLNYTFWKQEKG
jgi:putative membrane protein